MDRLRQVWHSIKQLDTKQKRIVVLFVIVIAATWLAVLVLLFSVLLG